MSIADEIRKLDLLRQEGAITEEEFQRAKTALLASSDFSAGHLLGGLAKNENLWAAALHLSQFLGYLIPLAGLAAPIILWQTKKESPLIDRHGRVVMNWILSQILWWVVSFVLCFVLVGIPMLWVFGVLVIVFPIIGAIRAYEGRVWSYPLTIRFFKEI
jgi:hypothetical protein